ncbi:neuroglobin-like [Polymixia lowei]
MGCAISGLGLVPKQDGELRDEVRLDEEDRETIKDTWRLIQEDIAKVGIIMFVKLFETHPECKDVFFLFRDVEDLETLRSSRELRAHGLRIMSFIEKTVARIDHKERLDQLILDLGKSHHHYNAPPKYYGYVGAEFIRAVQPILKDRWSPVVEKAWKTLFVYISSIMKQGFLDEERKERNITTPAGRERPERRLNVI